MSATAACYRLYALPGGERPGLVRSPDGGRIEVEVWRVPAAGLGVLTAQVQAPLSIGTVRLADGSARRGFLCEGHAIADADDITAHGSWRAYVELRRTVA